LLNITADGIYRVKTAAAVKAFQKNYGHAIDGIVGIRAWSVKFKKIKGSDLRVSNNHFNWTYRQ
jgi:peptidoglycan hydrolase-like protein with peptidoglycan-binding domain